MHQPPRSRGPPLTFGASPLTFPRSRSPSTRSPPHLPARVPVHLRAVPFTFARPRRLHSVPVHLRAVPRSTFRRSRSPSRVPVTFHVSPVHLQLRWRTWTAVQSGTQFSLSRGLPSLFLSSFPSDLVSFSISSDDNAPVAIRIDRGKIVAIPLMRSRPPRSKARPRAGKSLVAEDHPVLARDQPRNRDRRVFRSRSWAFTAISFRATLPLCGFLAREIRRNARGEHQRNTQ